MTEISDARRGEPVLTIRDLSVSFTTTRGATDT